jgi:hypothetical protein
MKKCCFVFLSLVLFTACSKSKFKADNLANPLQPNNSTALRLNGYYYETTGDLFQSVSFLYGNGVLIYAGGSLTSLEELDEYAQREFVSGTSYKEDKAGWGLYIIEGTSFKSERWYTGQGAQKSYIRYGEILNDSTFHITYSTRFDGSERSDKDEIYRFRAFTPKPDSTNKFVRP